MNEASQPLKFNCSAWGYGNGYNHWRYKLKNILIFLIGIWDGEWNGEIVVGQMPLPLWSQSKNNSDGVENAKEWFSRG